MAVPACLCVRFGAWPAFRWGLLTWGESARDSQGSLGGEVHTLLSRLLAWTKCQGDEHHMLFDCEAFAHLRMEPFCRLVMNGTAKRGVTV